MRIEEINEDKFNEFCNDFEEKSIYQTSAYAHVMQNQKFNYFYIGFYNDYKLIGASLIFRNKSLAFAPRGFLIDYSIPSFNKYILMLKKFLDKKNISKVIFSPMITKSFNNEDINSNYKELYNKLNLNTCKHLGYNNNFETIKPRFEAVLNIDKDFNELFNNIKKEYRTKIRKADKLGIKVYKGDIDTLDVMYEQIKHKYPREENYFKDCFEYFTDSQMYYTVLDPSEYLNIAKKNFEKQDEICYKINESILNPNKKNSKLLIQKKMVNDNLLNIYKKELAKAIDLNKKYKDNIITSTAYCIVIGDTVYLFMDGYNKEFKNYNSKHLLIWKLIERFSQLGYKKFNFGGIANPENHDKKYNGLNNFKLNFGCDVIEYIGDFEITCNNLKFVINNPNNAFDILKK